MDSIRLGELCAATSLFTDLGTGQPVEHGLRTCLVAMRLAEAMGLEPEIRREVFFVSLLRFLGCTADSYRIAELFDGDDVGLLAGMAPASMGSPLEEIAGLIRTAGRAVGIPGGLGALAKALSDPGGKTRLLDAHCEVASRLAADMDLPAGVPAALDLAYARWDGGGVPSGVGGEDVPTSIRISIVARDLELWAREFGARRAGAVVSKRSGRAYDPAIVEAVAGIGIEVLRTCDDDLWDVVVDLEPDPKTRLIGADSVRSALQALGDFADLKVPEFTGHARRVRRIVDRGAEISGLTPEEIELAVRAAAVHDVGVVGTPGSVWQSTGRSPADAEQARLHPIWSERLLTRVSGLESVAQTTGRHHERSDGRGYPAGVDGDLGRCAGLLACAEFYDEGLRQHARGRVVEDMLRIQGSGGLSPVDVAAVLEVVGAKAPIVEIERPAGLTEREVDVLRLLARGETNRGIAHRLGISAKTVGSHVEHIYAKAGVRSRAAATLFAVDHDLVL